MFRVLLGAFLLLWILGCAAGAPDRTSLTPDSTPIPLPLLFGFRCSVAMPAARVRVSFSDLLAICGGSP